MGINATTGAVFGTPTVAGVFNFTVTVQDSGSPQQSTSKVLSITVAQTPDCFTISSSANPSNGGSVAIQPTAPCYSSPDVLTLKATPATGFEFSTWVTSGIILANASAGSTTGHLTGTASITASFRSVAQPSAPFFDVEPPNPRVGELVVFSDQSTDLPTSWSWDFDGDGKADAISKVATLSYSRPGTYTVRLTESNSHGSATATRTVTVSEARPFLEFLDPNPTLLVAGAVTRDTQRLASGGRTVFGASADGVTTVLVRSVVPGPGSVTFSLGSANIQKDDGALSNPLSSDRQQFNTLTVPAVQVAGTYVALALYTTPADFNMNGKHADDATRAINVSATFQPTSGTFNGSTVQALYLVRPPLFLIHGVWSSASTWTMPLPRDPRWANNVDTANYGDAQAGNTSAASLATNAPFIGIQLRAFKRLVQRDFRVAPGQVGIAVTQVDVVAHSMGGLLARLAWEPRDDNYQAGDIHKLITLDSPHLGSPVATALELLRNSSSLLDLTKYDLVAVLMAYFGMDITGGAVADLATGSAAIKALPATSIPTHALVGAPPICSFLEPISFVAGPAALSLGLENDGLVTRTSQEGGLGAGATDPPVRTDDGCHIALLGGNHNTKSKVYSDRAIALLNTPVTDQSVFGHFPTATAAVVRTLSEGSRIAPFTPSIADPIKHGSLHLKVVGGRSVAGSAIKASVEIADEITSVIYVSPGTVASSRVGPDFAADLIVPAEALGTMSVQAFAIGPENTYYDSERVDIVLSSPGTPLDLAVAPKLVQMAQVGEFRQISITALYPDSVWRDVTGRLDAVYATSAPEVVSVTPTGLLVATGPGLARVSITYGGLNAFIPVYVDLAGKRRAVSH
jgi:PKD repeat protein